jgi:hypothetical protein
MLIRLINGELIEYPDELGALALANPRHGDVADFSLDEVNLLLNMMLASIFDENITLEQNIEKAKKHCSAWGNPDAANLEKALALIKHYNANMALKDIGYSDMNFLLDAYGIQSSRLKDEGYIINQQAHEVGKVPELGASTKCQRNT